MIQAIGKNVIARAIFPEKSIILTSKDEEPIHYEVLSVGKDVKEISVGDLIFPPAYASQTIFHENEKLYVLNLENICAKK